jgi:hypothetical protein
MTLTRRGACAVMGTLLFGCGNAGEGSGFPTAPSGPGSGPGAGAGGSITGGTSTNATTSVGAAGSIVVPTGAGGAGGSTGAPDNPDAACVGIAKTSEALNSDIFIMLDKSGSMHCPAADDTCTSPSGPMPPTRWTAVTDAINGFVAAPESAGVGVGIGFFPAGSGGNSQCNVAAYAAPTVAIAPLPDNAMAISNAVAMNAPNGGTPTRPALEGAIEYARAYTRATPDRTAAVVFVTDGVPNGCSSTVDNSAAAASAGFTGTPSIKTYVVGLGATASLNQIALAGSGGTTQYFPATGDVKGELMKVLKQITAVTCDYAIPTPGPQGIDFTKVNVDVRAGSTGPLTRIFKVDDASQCGAAGGWFYDKNPPLTPTRISLCPQSCGPLQMTEGSGVQVLFGCPIDVPVPK